MKQTYYTTRPQVNFWEYTNGERQNKKGIQTVYRDKKRITKGKQVVIKPSKIAEKALFLVTPFLFSCFNKEQTMLISKNIV